MGNAEEESIVVLPASITVTKNGQLVFQAAAGRLGFAMSASCDFLCFASGVIGASYTILEDAARRIAGMGYETVFAVGAVEQRFAPTRS